MDFHQRCWAVRALLCLGLLASAGCGGGSDATEPNFPYPAVAGIYQMDGGFDGATRSQASFTGSLTLTQANRTVPDLGATASITATIEGQVFSISNQTASSASVTPAGVITVQFAGGGASWTFSGTLSGRIITGRHTLSDGTSTTSGDWTGVKP